MNLVDNRGYLFNPFTPFPEIIACNKSQNNQDTQFIFAGRLY